jgi:haloalkane dehalogenase
MHYVDEGQGPILVMVHGTPVWSFLYRNFIKDLSKDFRCIVPDHLGFGLSDKPANASYRPQDLARNLAEFIERLGLRDITLIVHDFGGPIGLSYALDHPEQVTRLVLFNTWMWPLNDEKYAVQAGKLFGGTFGKLLYTRFNISPRVLYPSVFGDKTKLRRDIQHQYIQATSTPDERIAMWTFARELIGSSEWYQYLWERRERIANKPALVLWGMKDTAFRPAQLERWKALLTNARIIEFPTAGHFVQEEEPEQAIAAIRAFLAAQPANFAPTLAAQA